MTISVVTFCGYPSYQKSGDEWEKSDWDAYKMIKALKGGNINGYVDIPAKPVVRMTNNNKEAIGRVFGGLVAREIDRRKAGNPLIVPVPSSGCLNFGDDPKARRLAQNVVNHLPDGRFELPFKWKTPQKKASQNGPRHAFILKPNLALDDLPQDPPIVLIDDVLTTGGHISACASVLRDKGYNVLFGVCMGRTVNRKPPKMFGRVERLVNLC